MLSIYYLGSKQQSHWSGCTYPKGRLNRVFVALIWQKQVFSWCGSYINIYKNVEMITSEKKKKNKKKNTVLKLCTTMTNILFHMDCVKRIWYLSPMRAAKVQASLRIRAVSPEPPLLAHTSSESRGTFRQKARSLASLNGWACAVKICHDGMLEDTNSLDGAHMTAKIEWWNF